MQNQLPGLPEEMLQDFYCHLRFHASLSDSEGEIMATLHLDPVMIEASSPSAAVEMIAERVACHSLSELVGETGAQWTAHTPSHYRPIDEFSGDNQRIDRIVAATDGDLDKVDVTGWSADVLDRDDHVLLSTSGGS